MVTCPCSGSSSSATPTGTPNQERRVEVAPPQITTVTRTMTRVVVKII